MGSLGESVRIITPDAQINQQFTHCQFKPWRSKLKAFLVTAALWGLIPFLMAGFSVKFGGLRFA